MSSRPTWNWDFCGYSIRRSSISGRQDDFMICPLKAVNLIHRMMSEMLEKIK
jgi:hypothetical protein